PSRAARTCQETVSWADATTEGRTPVMTGRMATAIERTQALLTRRLGVPIELAHGEPYREADGLVGDWIGAFAQPGVILSAASARTVCARACSTRRCSCCCGARSPARWAIRGSRSAPCSR